MGCARSACSNTPFSSAVKMAAGVTTRRPPIAAHPGILTSNSPTSGVTEPLQSGLLVSSTSAADPICAINWSSRNFFRPASSACRSSKRCSMPQGCLNPRPPATVQPQPRHSPLLPWQHAEGRVGDSRHEINILSIELDDNDVVFQLAALHRTWFEEILLAARTPASVGFEPRRSRQTQEQPRQMFPIAVPLAPHLLHILRFLFTLFLLLGLPELVRRVSKLLNPVIDLAQFGLGRVIGRNN